MTHTWGRLCTSVTQFHCGTFVIRGLLERGGEREAVVSRQEKAPASLPDSGPSPSMMAPLGI